MTELLIPVLAASVVGSTHCAGMCGGLVAFAVGDGKTRALPHVAYHGLRGLGYVTLGTLGGAIGSAMDHVGVRAGVGRVAGVVAGALMLAWGAAKLLDAAGVGVGRVALPGRLEARLGAVVGALARRPPAVRSALVGACTAALPCGWLHAFVVVAAGTGGAAAGAAVMAAFWLGTVPALVGLGASVQVLRGRLGRQASLVSALLLVGIGVANVMGRLDVPLALLGAPGPSAKSLPGGHSAAGLVPDHPCCHAH
jgi:hypothetical protein